METTLKEYEQVFEQCRDVFKTKAKDYGHTWRVFRLPSLTDQMLIKARRIRQLESAGFSAVGEGVVDEYKALVNYGIMALVQLTENPLDELDPEEDVLAYYDDKKNAAKALMIKKNSDYGEAWRDMRTSSITDLIYVKLLRIKSIESNDGQTLVSEGIDSNYLDIVNYAIFALILLNE